MKTKFLIIIVELIILSSIVFVGGNQTKALRLLTDEYYLKMIQAHMDFNSKIQIETQII